MPRMARDQGAGQVWRSERLQAFRYLDGVSHAQMVGQWCAEQSLYPEEALGTAALP
jgi:hypothetical protein